MAMIITGGSLEVEPVKGEDAIALIAINQESKLKIRLILDRPEVGKLVNELGAALVEMDKARAQG
jgi:hypothetical protein